MSRIVLQKIKNLLDENEISYSCFSHAECQTSAESAAVRAEAGFTDVTGAKALLMKLSFSNGIEDRFGVFVLDGEMRLNSKNLKSQIPNLKKTRFSTADELAKLSGVESGALPPFAEQIFPAIPDLYVDKRILECGNVGFNAGGRGVSIIMQAEDYFRAAQITAVLDFSE